MVGAPGRRHRALRQGRHRAPRVAEGPPRRPRVAGRGGHRLGRQGRRRQAQRRRALRARDDLGRAARGAGGARRRPRRPAVAAVHRRGRRDAVRDEGRPLRRARDALRPAAARGARARAGHAVADRERGGAAAQARRQLGPGDDPRLPRAARLRGARPLAPRRPLPARAARALPAHVRRRGRRRTRPTCSSACGPSTTRRSSTCGARAPTTGPRWRSRTCSAASCARSSAPGSPTR